MSQIINDFHQPGCEFLSNFYILPQLIKVEVTLLSGDTVELVSDNTESIYQASKVLNTTQAIYISGLSPRDAKKAGKLFASRSTGDKLNIMKKLIEAKFDIPEMKTLLQSTGDAELIEGNRWGDVFWGYDFNLKTGCNFLGRIIQDKRDRESEVG